MQDQQTSLEDEWDRENLRLTPLERMRQHDASVRRILAARNHLGNDDDNES